MKIKAIAAICRQCKNIVLYYDGTDRVQWIGAGGGIYPLYGMPELDEETVLRVLDVPEKDFDKYIVRYTSLPSNVSFHDTDDSDGEIPDPLLSIGYGGEVLLPLRTSLGLRFLDPMLLKPLEDKQCRLYEREDVNGVIWIAVKEGMLLTGLLLPETVEEQDIAKRLELLHEELVQTITLREMREKETPPPQAVPLPLAGEEKADTRPAPTDDEEEIGQLAIDPETGEVLET